MKSLSIQLLLLWTTGVTAVRDLRIVSPLQALTIWDSDVTVAKNSTARSRFLPKYRAGLDAETKARKSLAEKRNQQLQVEATSSDNWSGEAVAAAGRARTKEDQLLEASFDRSVAPFKQAEEATRKLLQQAKKNSKNPYQFVGLVGKSEEKPITWFARKKPANSHWSVRLVHVNRDAILKDLFDQGKIDIFSRYDNTGQTNPETNLPIIRSKYSVRQRSWK
jgi:hypothetical protein